MLAMGRDLPIAAEMPWPATLPTRKLRRRRALSGIPPPQRRFALLEAPSRRPGIPEVSTDYATVINQKSGMQPLKQVRKC